MTHNSGESDEFHAAFDEAIGEPSLRQVQGWSMGELHYRIGSGKLSPQARSMAESVLRQKEAWTMPAARALRISYLALGVSAATLVFSVVKAFLEWRA